MSLESEIVSSLKAARNASRELALCDAKAKNRALSDLAMAIRAGTQEILEANRKDLEQAKSEGVGGAFLERLTLDDKRIEAIARGVEQIAELPDPVGETIASWRRPNGLEIAQVRVPI
jgi:glutamate-5-semialdehyde dehydrogenase